MSQAVRQVAGGRGKAAGRLSVDAHMSNRTFPGGLKVGDLSVQMGVFSALLWVDEAGSVAALIPPLPAPALMVIPGHLLAGADPTPLGSGGQAGGGVSTWPGRPSLTVV